MKFLGAVSGIHKKVPVRTPMYTKFPKAMTGTCSNMQEYQHSKHILNEDKVNQEQKTEQAINRTCFRLPRRTDEKCSLLRYFAASSGKFIPTFRDNLRVPHQGTIIHAILDPGNGADRLSRNVCKKLPLLAA